MLNPKNKQWLKPVLFKAAYQCFALLLIASFLGFGFNLIKDDGLPLPKEWSENRVLNKNGADISIPLDDAERHHRSKTAWFLDARDAASFSQGHIKGAINIPFEDVDNYFFKVIKTVRRDKLIITYCDGQSCNLSHELALFLSELGYNNVRVLVNGWEKWQEAGLPLGVPD